MALDQTVRLGGKPSSGPCERVIQLLESSVHDHLQGTGEIARLVSSQPGSLKCGQAIQMLESSVGTQLQGTGEIAKLVGVVASLQNDREFVRAAYEADMFRIQDELEQLRAAIALAHISAGAENLHAGLQENNVQDDPREAAMMREMYKELENTDIEVQKAIQENARLNEEINICRLAYEQDVSALEGMLQHAMQEADRLRATLASEGKTPPELTPRTFKKAFERSAPALTPRTIIKAYQKSASGELTPRTFIKTFGGSEHFELSPGKFVKGLEGTVIPCGEPRDVDEASPVSPASIRSSSNEPESEHVDERSPLSTPNLRTKTP
jgi:hypothetical protein